MNGVAGNRISVSLPHASVRNGCGGGGQGGEGGGGGGGGGDGAEFTANGLRLVQAGGSLTTSTRTHIGP
jgi:hypothetical protein